MNYFNKRLLSSIQALIAVLLFLTAGLLMANAEMQEISSTPPAIVVSIEPLYEIVSSIAHQVVKPDVIYTTLAETQRPLSEEQKKRLDQADIIIRVGQGFEPYLDQYIQAQGQALQNKTITLSLYIPLLDKKQLSVDVVGKHNNFINYTDRQSNSDLRFWMDPRLVKMLVMYIAPTLATMDPEHLEEYLDNEIIVKEQLKKVEQKMLLLFGQLSLEQKILIASFNPYLTNRYMSFAEIKAIDSSLIQDEDYKCIKLSSFDTIPLNLEYTEKALYAMMHSLEFCTYNRLSVH